MQLTRCASISKLSDLVGRRVAKLSFVILAFAFGTSLSAPPVATGLQELPEGKGVEIVRERCLICHEADLIVQQRLSYTGWAREVDKMIRWGATMSEAEKGAVVNYLTVYFGPRPLSRSTTAAPTESSPGERGLEIFKSKCLLCHEADLTEQQRLSRAGWMREVEKMIRWGAPVTEAEKEPLVDYLFKNYGPRGRRVGK